VDAVWDHDSGNNRVMNLVRGSSALTTLAYNPDAVDDLVDKDSLVCQFVSDILPPQAIAAQLIFLNVLALEVAASNNLQLSWGLRAFNTAGSTALATLLSVARNGVEVGTALTGASSSRTSTLATMTEDFRLVLEVGLGGLPVNTATDTHNGSIQFGEAPASGTVPTFPQHGDTTTGGPPFLLFSQSLLYTVLSQPFGARHLPLPQSWNKP
jgi:hypothetical protein